MKKIVVLSLVVLLSSYCFADAIQNNDGSAFITKAEFDSLKSAFQSQIDNYNMSIDAKIDAAISSYLAGIKINKKIELENLYDKLQSNVVGSKVLWSSQATCNYNKKKYTNLGYKFDVREKISVKQSSSSKYNWINGGINHEGIVMDWPIQNIVTYGGEYQLTDDKTTIDIVGDEICFNEWNQPVSNYFGYYPQSKSDGQYVTVGAIVKSINSKLHLSTTYDISMMWLYDCECTVVTSNSPKYILEPNNSESIYTFDNKPGYKTFSWPAAFVSGTTAVRSPMSVTWQALTTDKSLNDAWKDIAPDQYQIKRYAYSENDFDYANTKCRMKVWGITTNLYPWIDTSYFKNTSTAGIPNNYYHPGACFFKDYGEYCAVNSLILKEPKDSLGIHLKMSEGFPVVKAQKTGKCKFVVKADVAGTLIVYNIGTGSSSHTTITCTTKTLAANTNYNIEADADTDEIITVAFLPTSTTSLGELTITDTMEEIE